MRYEQFRDLLFLVEHALHQQLLDSEETAIYYRGRCCHTQGLTGEASLAKKLAGVQGGYDRFFALFGNDSEPYLAFTNIEYGIRRLSLLKDASVGAVFHRGFPMGDSGEQGFPIDGLVFYNWHYILPLFAESEMRL
jgi:hypothetical protein